MYSGRHWEGDGYELSMLVRLLHAVLRGLSREEYIDDVEIEEVLERFLGRADIKSGLDSEAL